MLAGGETSRLHRELVLETRLSKDVSGSSSAWESAGQFALESTAAKGAKAEEVLDAIESAFDAAVREIKANPPRPDELARALALFEKQSYARLTSPLSRAITLATGFAQKNDPRHYQKEFARYYQVTPADLTRVAGTYLTPEKVVVWTESVSPGQPRSEAAKAGPNPSAAVISRYRTPTAHPVRASIGRKCRDRRPARLFRAPRLRAEDALERNRRLVRCVEDAAPGLGRAAGALGDGRRPAGQVRACEPHGRPARQGDDQPDRDRAGRIARNARREPLRPVVDRRHHRWLEHDRPEPRTVAQIVAEVLASPRFDPKDFDRERSLALARLVQGPDNVNWLAGRALPALLYGKEHPYANPADGYAETVKALTLDDVKSFHARARRSQGSDADRRRRRRARRLVRRCWNRPWDGGRRRTPVPRPGLPLDLKADPGVIYLVDKPGAVQSVLKSAARGSTGPTRASMRPCWATGSWAATF